MNWGSFLCLLTKWFGRSTSTCSIAKANGSAKRQWRAMSTDTSSVWKMVWRWNADWECNGDNRGNLSVAISMICRQGRNIRCAAMTERRKWIAQSDVEIFDSRSAWQRLRTIQRMRYCSIPAFHMRFSACWKINVRYFISNIWSYMAIWSWFGCYYAWILFWMGRLV